MTREADSVDSASSGLDGDMCVVDPFGLRAVSLGDATQSVLDWRCHQVPHIDAKELARVAKRALEVIALDASIRGCRQWAPLYAGERFARSRTIPWTLCQIKWSISALAHISTVPALEAGVGCRCRWCVGTVSKCIDWRVYCRNESRNRFPFCGYHSCPRSSL